MVVAAFLLHLDPRVAGRAVPGHRPMERPEAVLGTPQPMALSGSTAGIGASAGAVRFSHPDRCAGAAMKRKTTFTRVRRPLGPAVWYLESDHLLVSNQRLFWAEYHRFYFADLRSITF